MRLLTIKLAYVPCLLIVSSTAKPDAKTFITIVSKIGAAGVEPYRVRSYPTPPTEIDPSPYGHKWTVLQCARGTCAAPLYLSPLRIASGNSIYLFQDAGSSGFNNPAKIAASEAQAVFGADAAITLVSLGTGIKSLVGKWKDLNEARRVMDDQVDSVMNQIVESAEQTDKPDNKILRFFKGVRRTHKNVQNSPDLVRRIATQLLEVATDTEITHSQVHEQFRRG